MTKSAKANDLEKNFPSFLVTPTQNDPSTVFEKALVCPQAPGHAICLSVPHFIDAKTGYEVGKVYKDLPAIKKGFGLEELLLSFLVGGVVAVTVDELVIHKK